MPNNDMVQFGNARLLRGMYMNDVGSRFYEQRGASSLKPDVKSAIRGLDEGLFPGGFCKAIPDLLHGSAEHCVLLHADGAGTKSILAYLHFAETGDPSAFRGIAQDSLVMNIDDLLCVGATGPFVFSNTIGRNARLIPAPILREIVQGYEDFSAALRPMGIELLSCGGETADLGDLVRTVVVDSSVIVRMRRADFINCNEVKAGHVIIGLSSFGRAKYEASDNSGVGTNGFTALRHGLISADVVEPYPETFDPTLAALAYTGKHALADPLPDTDSTIAQACLSPTRTYAPVVAAVLKELRGAVSAMFHNTGGGLTKCLGFGRDVRYVKNNLFEVPPIFRLFQADTQLSFREMVQTFNMGHRFEIMCEPSCAESIVALSGSFGVEAKVIGSVEVGTGRSLTIEGPAGTVEFSRAD